MSSRRITIFDTTLRDGEQAPGIALRPDEKVEIAEQLERLGVDVIEAGFAASSPGDFEGVREVARAAKRVTVASLCRASSTDIDAAAAALEDAPALAHPHFPRDQRAAHGEKASPHARRGRRPRVVLGLASLRERRRGRVLLRGRDPIRSRVRRHRLPGCGGGRRNHDQPPGHRRLHAAGRVHVVHPVRAREVPRARARDPLRPLPRRPRTRGCELARSAGCRRAAARVHGERHRRAGRQCLARGDRDGDARAR